MKSAFGFILVFVVCTGMGILADVIIKTNLNGLFTFFGGAAGLIMGVVAAAQIVEDSKKGKK